jgi:hypothetical protein
MTPLDFLVVTSNVLLVHALPLMRSEDRRCIRPAGLHLSKLQAQRLWNLDPRSCDVIFEHSKLRIS